MKKLIKMQEHYEITYNVDYERDAILSVHNYHYRKMIKHVGWIEGSFVKKSKYTAGAWKKKGLKIEKINI